MAIQICCTVSAEQRKFLDDNPDLSASAILQRGIEENIENSRVSAKKLQELTRRIEFLQSTVSRQRDFLEAKGLMDEFILEK